MLKIGAKAPAFALPDQDGTSTSLAGLAGQWVVLYFYPRDDTPGCTIEACEFTASMPKFGKLDATVLGCSADGAAAHKKFIAKYRLGVRLLTDADHKVMTAYGAWGEKTMYGKKVVGVVRSTVLIAPDGTVAHHWPKVKAEGHAEEVRARLAELRSGTKASAPAAKKATKAAAKKPVARKATKAKGSKAGKPSAAPVAKKAAAKRAAAKPVARKSARKAR